MPLNTLNSVETDRLILRPFVADDYKGVYEFASNDVVQELTGEASITSLEEAKAIIEKTWFNDYEKYGYGRFATIYKPDNKLIGFTGLKYLPEIDETDIGYRYLPAYWGKGIATEAAQAMINYGFEHLGLEKIIGVAMPENIASCRVLEKIGLVFYKEAEYLDSDRKYNWYQILKGGER